MVGQVRVENTARKATAWGVWSLEEVEELKAIKVLRDIKWIAVKHKEISDTLKNYIVIT